MHLHAGGIVGGDSIAARIESQMCYQNTFSKISNKHKALYLYRTYAYKLLGYFSAALFFCLFFFFTSAKYIYFNWSKNCYQKIRVDNISAQKQLRSCMSHCFCLLDQCRPLSFKALYSESCNTSPPLQSLWSKKPEVLQRASNLPRTYLFRKPVDGSTFSATNSKCNQQCYLF